MGKACSYVKAQHQHCNLNILVIHWFFRRSFRSDECSEVVKSGVGICLSRVWGLGALITRVFCINGVIPCNFQTDGWLGSPSGVHFHFKRSHLSGCWFSRFLGSPSLLAGSGKEPGGWVWAALGYHIPWEHSRFLLSEKKEEREERGSGWY